MPLITLKDIEAAQKRIEPYIRKTPWLKLELGREIQEKNLWAKCELFQKTGSFKLRGATNCIVSQLDKARKQGVIAASSGNHAQGVAAICHELNVPATIVMPETTPPIKVANTKSWGAKVELVGQVYDDSFDHAIKVAEKNHLVFVHPFRDPLVIAGQGTMALEMLKEPQFAQIEAVAIAVAGGGMITGCATAFKAIRKDLKVYGITAKNAPSVYESYRQKKCISIPPQYTLADTAATKRADESMLPGLLELVDGFFSISEEAIAHSIALLAEKAKMITEGAGAIPLAAVVEKMIPEKNIALILCGGNIDLTSFSHVLERGLVSQGRLVRIVITVPDRPGGLHSITGVLAEQGANIIQVFHSRSTLRMGVGETKIEVDLETKGADHTQKIMEALEARGLKAEISS